MLAGFLSPNKKKSPNFHSELKKVIFFSGEQPLVVGSTPDDGSRDDLRNVRN